MMYFTIACDCCVQALPSEENAQKFLCDLVSVANKSKRPYFYHEAIDAGWKRIWAPCNECTGLSKELRCVDNIPNRGCELDYHWGVFTEDHRQKNITIPPVSGCGAN